MSTTTTNSVNTIYNPVYQGAENTYVCATPSDLQALYDSIDLETLKISDIKASQQSSDKHNTINNYTVTITNDSHTIVIILRTSKEW